MPQRWGATASPQVWGRVVRMLQVTEIASEKTKGF